MAALNRRHVALGCDARLRRAQPKSRDRGAELVEFALVLPVLLLILIAIMDFAFMFRNYEIVTNAAREGARVGVLSDYQLSDAVARAEAYLTASGLTDAHASPVAVPTTVTVTVAGVTKTMNAVQVTVTYPHGFLLLGPISRWFGSGLGAITLTGTATMRTEDQSGS